MPPALLELPPTPAADRFIRDVFDAALRIERDSIDAIPNDIWTLMDAYLASDLSIKNFSQEAGLNYGSTNARLGRAQRKLGAPGMLGGFYGGLLRHKLHVLPLEGREVQLSKDEDMALYLGAVGVGLTSMVEGFGITNRRRLGDWRTSAEGKLGATDMRGALRNAFATGYYKPLPTS